MKRQQVKNCSFPQWYPLLKNVTIESRVIELPTPVQEYLSSDGLILPSGCDQQSLNRVGLEGDSDDDEDWDTKNVVSSTMKVPNFPEFQAEVERNMAELGGSVFPKLNWSSPKDAVWISFGRTLQCTSFYDIVLLLKSSDFVTHDLTDPFGQCIVEPNCDNSPAHVKYHLILRQWQQILPESEFRCFVRNSSVLGISQRHQGIYFPSLADSKQSVCDDIIKFFNESIKGVFPEKDFTFDVWIRSPGDVILIDFNPFGCVTDSLLFSWEELWSEGLTSLQYRIVTDKNVEPDPYRFYAVPQDFVHLTTGEDPAKFIDLLHMKIQTSNDSSSSGDEA
jgi:D123